MSTKRKADQDGPVFTFKEVRKVRKQEAKRGGRLQDSDKVGNNTNGCSADLHRFLTRLGVTENERETYLSMCRSCNIGNQELSRHASRTLFGEEGQQQLHTGFLKRTPPDHVYFITILVTSTRTSSPRTRKPDTIWLCLPPATGSTHSTKSVEQERLASSMIMKAFFVVRYIYRTTQEAIYKNKDRKGYCVPLINITTDLPSPWFNLMKEKIRRGDSEYARSLSLEYCCNVL